MKLQEIAADQEETVSLDDLKLEIDERMEEMVEEHKIECDQDGWCHQPHLASKASTDGSQHEGYRGTKLSAVVSKQEEYRGTKLSEMNPKPMQNLLTQE